MSENLVEFHEPSKKSSVSRVESFEPSQHYDVICQWWIAQKWPVLPLQHLPRTGFMVFNGDQPACAGFLYKTDSAICWLEWIVANPEVRHEARSQALSVLISTARVTAKALGFQSIFTSSNNASLEHRLRPHGFAVTDTGVRQFVCNLQEVR